MRTELVWEGKYDSAGNRVAPLRVDLPFQTVETVNESAADRKPEQEIEWRSVWKLRTRFMGERRWSQNFAGVG